MSRRDVVPEHLRSPIGPTNAQWHAMATALLRYDGHVKATPVTMRRLRWRGWLDRDDRVNKIGLAALLVERAPRGRPSRADRT
jgi:hypothetical protein